ncbi:DNA polymerase III subunit epsilon [Candidatus Hepatincolaceae symbiont of Richtersius coronifer]
MKNRKIILDTETTGLNPRLGDKIVEIACIELIDDAIMQGHFHYYLNPERAIPNQATAIHGITNEHVQGSPKFAEIVEELLLFIGNSQIIAHNSEFDRGFLNAELTSLNKKPLPFTQFIDTLSLAKKKFPGQKNTLDELCKRLNVDLSSRKNHHGALIDIKLLGEVYFGLLRGQKSIFEEQISVEKISFNRLNQTEFYNQKAVNFQYRSYPLAEEEEKKHQEFLKNIKNHLWI